MKKIRVGAVGVGYFGQFHAEKYANMEGVELIGVVDVNPSRAKEIARRYRTQSYTKHSDLLNKVQAVSIAVPTSFHYAIAKDFLEQGIDVLIEKPVATTLEETDALIRLAESNRRILQVGHLERFNGALQALKGKFRNPLFIEAHRMGPFSGRGTDVNVVLDLMIHDIDILLSLVKADVKSLQAIGIPVLTPSADIAHAGIEFENGVMAHLTVSRVSPERVRNTRIFQSDGTLFIDFVSQKASFSKRGTPSGKRKNSSMVIREIPIRKVDPLEVEIQSFLQSVRQRKEAQVSGLDGKRALELAFRIIQKIEERATQHP